MWYVKERAGADPAVATSPFHTVTPRQRRRWFSTKVSTCLRCIRWSVVQHLTAAAAAAVAVGVKVEKGSTKQRLPMRKEVRVELVEIICAVLCLCSPFLLPYRISKSFNSMQPRPLPTFLTCLPRSAPPFQLFDHVVVNRLGYGIVAATAVAIMLVYFVLVLALSRRAYFIAWQIRVNTGFCWV